MQEKPHDFAITHFYTIKGIPKVREKTRWQFVGQNNNGTKLLFRWFAVDLWINKKDLYNYRFIQLPLYKTGNPNEQIQMQINNTDKPF